MNVQHGMQARVLTCVVAAVAVAWAGAVAPARAAAAGMTAGARAPGAGGVAAIGAVPAAGSWGRAITVPGLRALSKGSGYGRVLSVSCASAGNCAAAGHYWIRNSQLGFVADERHGRWGLAIAVPGLAALSAGQGADVVSVSCGSAGSCAAGGYYARPPNVVVPILATERAGRWGKAVALPGDGKVNSISCASAGNCLAGGGIAGENEYFLVGDAYVVQERAGRWGPVRLVPGLRKLEHGGDPEVAGSWVSSAACPSAGSCAVGGAYADRSGRQHGFVAAAKNGRWGTAIQVPGLAALNTGGLAEVTSVSCGSAGSCTAGGYYQDRHGRHGFVAVERHGAWGTAVQVPGLAALTTGGDAEVTSVSCGSAGSCAAGGFYSDRSHHDQGFVASEDNSVWGTAIHVPGPAALTTGGDAQVTSVSCGSAGSCAAGGFYSDRSHHHQGFVASEDNGVWGTAIQVPGLGALNKGGAAAVGSVSCALAGTCAAGGYYRHRRGHLGGFVVTQAR